MGKGERQKTMAEIEEELRLKKERAAQEAEAGEQRKTPDEVEQ